MSITKLSTPINCLYSHNFTQKYPAVTRVSGCNLTSRGFLTRAIIFLASPFERVRRRLSGRLLDRHELAASISTLPPPTTERRWMKMTFSPRSSMTRGLGAGERNRKWFDEVRWRSLWDVGSANLCRAVHGSIASRTQPMGPTAKPIPMVDEPSISRACDTHATAVLRHSDVLLVAPVCQQIGRWSRPKGNLWRVRAKNRASRSVAGARKP